MLFEVETDTSGDELQYQTPQALFLPTAAAAKNPGRSETGYAYDVTPNGERFLVNTSGSGDTTPLTLVLNWTNMVPQ